jgi:small multidrug resistance pump
MKPFVGYIILAIGIFTGIAANSFAKISDGFTKLTPTILCLILMCITMFSLSKAMSVIPVGITYASFAGLTIIATVVVGIIRFNQVPNLYSIIGLALIIAGVLMVNLLGNN